MRPSKEPACCPATWLLPLIMLLRCLAFSTVGAELRQGRLITKHVQIHPCDWRARLDIRDGPQPGVVFYDHILGKEGLLRLPFAESEIGRASCRESVWV